MKPIKTSDTPSGTAIPGQPTESVLTESVAQTRHKVAAELQSRPKRKIRIPLPHNVTVEQAAKMEKYPSQVVGLNGYNYHIRKGEWVEVPDVIAEILEEANII